MLINIVKTEIKLPRIIDYTILVNALTYFTYIKKNSNK